MYLSLYSVLTGPGKEDCVQSHLPSIFYHLGLLKEFWIAELQLREPLVKVVLDKVSFYKFYIALAIA